MKLTDSLHLVSGSILERQAAGIHRILIPQTNNPINTTPGLRLNSDPAFLSLQYHHLNLPDSVWQIEMVQDKT
jgi:hypothetical protein